MYILNIYCICNHLIVPHHSLLMRINAPTGYLHYVFTTGFFFHFTIESENIVMLMSSPYCFSQKP